MHLTGRVVAMALEGLLLLLLVAFAAYVSMGRILVANIDTFRQSIETRASDALNVPVTFEDLGGSWDYLDPTLTISGMRLGSSVWIGDVSARVNAIQSVRERGLVLSEVTVAGIEMRIDQQPDGSWKVDGLSQGGGGFDFAPLVRSVPHLKLVNLSGVDVEVNGQQRQYDLGNQPGTTLQLLEQGGEKLVSMPLQFQASEAETPEFSVFELVGRYRGDPRNLRTFFADLYLQLPLLELSDFLPQRDSEWRPRRLGVHGDFWLQAIEGEWEFKAIPVVEEFVVARGDRSVEVLKDVSARVFLRGATASNVSGRVSDLAGLAITAPFQLPPLDIAFVDDGQGRMVAARAGALDLGEIRVIANDLVRALEPDTAGLDALANLNPRGLLDETHVVISLDDPVDGWRVASRLVDVSVDSHRNSPIVSELSGIARFGPAGGYLDLIDDDFAITFPPAYESLWPFDHGRGRLSFDLAGGYPRITGDLIEVARGELRAVGALEIDLREERAERTWLLELGVLNADLIDAHDFIPNTVDTGLRDWLRRAIRQGRASRSGLVFSGTLDREAPEGSKGFEMFFDVTDTALEFDPAWPVVEEMDAIVYVNNRGVYSTDVAGSILESSMLADVAVPMSLANPPDSVDISGEISGGLGDGLRVLQDTPLAEQTGYLASQWTGGGDYAGRLQLSVPIGPREGEPVVADVTISLADNVINMGELDLSVSNIRSNFRYSTATGLESEAFTAMLFDQPVTGEINSEATPTGGAVRLSFRGMIGASALQSWSGQRILNAAEGNATYDAVLSVPYGDRASELAYVEATTDLAGFSVSLPAPLGKPQGEARQFVYRQSFLDEGFRIDLELDDEFRASMKSVDGDVVGGAVRFGSGPLGAVAYDNLDVFGELDFADYAEWEQAATFFQSDDGEPVEVAGMLDAVDVRIGTLVAFGVELDSVRTRITRDPGIWNVALHNEMLKGTISVADADDEPIQVALDYLRMPAGEEGDEADPLADIDPTAFTAIDFETAELMVGEDQYGEWRFSFRPTENGAVLEPLSAEVRGLSVADNSRVEWIRGEDGVTSRYSGDIAVADVASAFRQWGYASSIEGKDLKLNASLSWPGSPVMIDLYNVTGPVEIIEGSGRFVQAESGTGALKLLGIFDFASIARRFRFDFSDVVDSGLSFSEVNGRVRFREGIVSVIRPIEIVGSGSKFKVGGTVDLYTNGLDNDMIVTLPVSRNLPWYAAYSAIVTGPLVGAGVWLANKIFENQIDQMSSAKYRIEGTIDEPQIEFVSIFNDTVREAPEDGAEPAADTSTDAATATDSPGVESPGVDSPGVDSPGVGTQSPETAAPEETAQTGSGNPSP